MTTSHDAGREAEDIIGRISITAFPGSTNAEKYVNYRTVLSSLTRPPAQAGAASVDLLRADIAKLFEADGNASCAECGAPLFDHDATDTDAAEMFALCAGHRREGAPIYAYRVATPAASGEIPGGMVAWHGGDSAPADFDPTKPVMYPDGDLALEADNGGSPFYWQHSFDARGFPDAGNIIAYTPKASAETGVSRKRIDVRWMVSQALGDHQCGNRPALKQRLIDDITAALSAAPSAPATEKAPDRYANDDAAKVIYDGWSDQPGWVPWVERGNSDMQEKARWQAADEAVAKIMAMPDEQILAEATPADLAWAADFKARLSSVPATEAGEEA